MARLAKKLQDFEFHLEIQDDQEVILAHALREAICGEDPLMETEVMKNLGDLHFHRGKLSKDSAEFDKAAALYAAALLRCTDPEMSETIKDELEHSKHCRVLLDGCTPHYQWSTDKWSFADRNVLRVAEICDQADRSVGKSEHSIEQIYTEMLVNAIGNSNVFLELEVLKSLGDFYLKKGMKTQQLSKFSKAAAMYNKAMTRCEDPETEQTLHHRVRYMEKMREAASQVSRNASQQGMTSDGTVQEEKLTDRDHEDHLREGESSIARADLDSAEQHFAAALKTVHVTDPTAQQYQREVEPLCKLGDVYSRRCQQTGDGGDFVKAAALYNAAIARSEDQVLNSNMVTAIREVEKLFLKYILGIYSSVSQHDTEKHKKQLKEMRDQIKLEMETIDQQLDPYVHDEDDPCVKEIEAKRAQAVRHLFEKIAQQRKEFISLLVEECIGLMGPPPCKYALIGLGSQATGLVTPYSDLEFAILVEESEECLEYFRNLTNYLNLKVVNLGETILPAMGIKSLNDFYSKNPLDNWYYDSVTPRGFAFDGSMPKASKTPLGRQGTNKPSSELICTPENMTSILQNDVTLYLKEGYHLATILRNPCLIAGDQDLIDTYMAITVKILQADGGKMAQRLAQETLAENSKSNMYTCGKGKPTITTELTNVKNKIYRFPAVAVDCLALYSGITPTTVWKTIKEMENQQVISPDNALHLTVLTSISAELRLRTYIANGTGRSWIILLHKKKPRTLKGETSKSLPRQVHSCGVSDIQLINAEEKDKEYVWHQTVKPVTGL
ncbi:Hypp6273 [Branchiostoma lanceolatum]|uniref:Hypp6273 protein n=1 Tax=Branchiostoma lanceolatum TaxID=7740 RepID=A0A8J9YNU4_BRALA|nr:Hypp6273 [Branchiostoma lanceolatum]